MTCQSRISELAGIIQARTAEIEKYLLSRGLPLPSFEYSAANDLPQELRPAQHALLEASDELNALIQGPSQFLTMLAYEHNRTASVQAIVRFGLAKAFPVDQKITFANLGKACGLHTEEVSQLLRHAMTYRIFSEPAPGVVAHTAASRVLATDPNLVGNLQFALDEMGPAASRMVDAMERWPHSQETNETGFNLAYGTNDAFFASVGKNPVRASKLAAAMRSFLDTPPFAPHHLAQGFEWAGVEKMVDVGGSGGAVAVELARHFPRLHCVVQDLPLSMETAHIPEDVKDRVCLMPHDFFTEQLVHDADVYLLRRVLHDWSDLYCVKIIRALIPAMKKGARIVINDSLLPEYGAMSLFDQRFLRVTSLTMRQIQNAKERDVEDWRDLLHLADERLVLQEIRRPEHSALVILIVTLQDRTSSLL